MPWWRRPYLWLMVVVAIPLFLVVLIIGRGHMRVREQQAAWQRLERRGVIVDEYLVAGEPVRTWWQKRLEGYEFAVTISEQATVDALVVDDILRLRRVRGLAIETPLSKTEAERLAQLTTLEHLHVAHQDIAPNTIQSLCTAQSIQHCTLQQSQANDDCLAVIAQLPRLRNLELLDTNVSEEAAQALRAARPNVNISFRPLATD